MLPSSRPQPQSHGDMSATTGGQATVEVSEVWDEKKIKWDDHYDNPKSDLVLLSSNGVGFRVDTWTLRRQSQFINDLLDCPSEEQLSQAPIPLNHEAGIVRHFLDLFQPSIATVPILSVSSYSQLIDLSHLFQAPMVYDVVTSAILVRLDNREPDSDFPWEVFKLAARLDDSELAQAAVKKMDRPDKILVNGPSSTFEEVPPRYLHALLRCSLRLTVSNVDYWLPESPTKAAAAFKVTQPKVDEDGSEGWWNE